MTTRSVVTRVVTCTAPHRCAYCANVSPDYDDGRVVDTYAEDFATGAIAWVCHGCAEVRVPQLVKALDFYGYELGFLFDDRMLGERRRDIWDESVRVLTDGLSPGHCMPHGPVVATESDVSRLDHAACLIADRRGTGSLIG